MHFRLPPPLPSSFLKTSFALPLGLAWLLFSPASAFACLWDEDTIQMETKQFPDAYSMIVGYFLRHSKEFYAWRAADRQAKRKAQIATLNDYDDLAVALDKIGQPEKGIDILWEKDKKKPNDYRTCSNLGTLYFHAGQLEKGLPFIKKAIQINPDAHFGREIYQQLLVEYVLTLRKDGKIVLPLGKAVRRLKIEKHQSSYVYEKKENFVSFLIRTFQKKKKGYRFTLQERKKAVKGILGMMHFGNFRSPILLEALGDLLLIRDLRGKGLPSDQEYGLMMEKAGIPPASFAPELALYAYLKASLETKDPALQDSYRLMAEMAVNSITGDKGTSRSLVGLPKISKKIYLKQGKVHELSYYNTTEFEYRLKADIAKAHVFFEGIQRDERAWIAAGKHPEREFEKKYYKPLPVLLPLTASSKESTQGLSDAESLIRSKAFLKADLLLGPASTPKQKTARLLAGLEAVVAAEPSHKLRSNRKSRRTGRKAQRKSRRGKTLNAPVISGAIDKEIVRKIIDRHRSQIKYCYEKHLAAQPDLEGSLVVAFRIKGDGRVSAAEIQDDRLPNPAVGDCVIWRIRFMRFPPPKGGSLVKVRYPFLFLLR